MACRFDSGSGHQGLRGFSGKRPLRLTTSAFSAKYRLFRKSPIPRPFLPRRLDQFALAVTHIFTGHHPCMTQLLLRGLGPFHLVDIGRSPGEQISELKFFDPAHYVRTNTGLVVGHCQGQCSHAGPCCDLTVLLGWGRHD